MMKSRLPKAAVAVLFSALTYECIRGTTAIEVEATEGDATHALAAEQSLDHPKLKALVRTGAVFRLRRPDMENADIGPPAPAEQAPSDAPFFALAYQYQTPVFASVGANQRPFALVRRGRTLRATERVTGKGCRKGAWYALAGGGFVCTQEGFTVSQTAQKFWIRQPQADPNKALFHRYARVTHPGALRYHRMPTEQEENEIAAQLAAFDGEGEPSLPDVVQARMVGDYFVALDRLEKDGERAFYRTVRGRYVRAEHVEPRDPPGMHGEVLGDKAMRLPLAFVYGEGDAPLYRARGERFEEAGVAEPHARFELRGVASSYALGSDDFAVPLARVRIARKIPRPSEIGPKERWIHVNLTEQTLVAYLGDEPRFATLVSSGKEETGHGTPTGLYWIREKHLSVTMSGSDPEEGVYEVAEVPWTQFYHDGYALHGAYWHDTFGKTRSHGCVNVSPPDGRWLFQWTSPRVAPSFHARRQAKGTAVYLTRSPSASEIADAHNQPQ